MAEAFPLDSDTESEKLLKRYLEYAESALEKCKSLSHISGAQKLERKCQSELKYLKSLSKRRGGFDDSNVRSSNLGHYLGVLHAAENLTDVTHILQAFSCPGRSEPLHADVVAGSGRVWIKVIARKAQALHLVWAGKGQYGEKDVLFQAEEYVRCTKEHPVNFVEPQVLFAFYNGVTDEMASASTVIGVRVLGNVVSVSEDIVDKLRHLDMSDSDSEMSDDDDDSCFPESDIVIDSESERYSDRIQCLDDSKQYSDSIQNMEIGKFPSLNEPSNISREDIKKPSSFSDNNVAFQNNDAYNPSAFSGAYVSNAFQNKDMNNPSSFNNSQSQNDDTSDGELLMLPLIDYSAINGLLSSSVNNSVDSIRRVNLDVTSLITLVSAVTHGRCFYRFKEPVLSEQAMEERTEGCLPRLEEFIEGKELYACETAIDSFKTILDTLGGDAEMTRSDYLLSQLTVVPDNPSFRTQCLPRTGKIKDRSKIIFGTGDSLKAVTLTANSAFVRAATHQGCLYAAYIHPARALTEKKEHTAELLGEFRELKYPCNCSFFRDVCPDVKR